jgi:magnesium transporter
VIGLLPPEVVAEAVRELDSDDVVDILEDLEDAQRRRSSTRSMTATGRRWNRRWPIRRRPPAASCSARSCMAPEHWTVGEMIDYLRAHKTDLPEQFYHVILTDPRMKPTGYVTLGRLLSTARGR